jgi:hypothetical protein
MKKYQQLITLGVLLCSFNSSALPESVVRINNPLPTKNQSLYISLISRINKICEADTLTPEEARGRVEWAYRCGHISYQEKMNHLRVYDFSRDSPVNRPYPKFPVFTVGEDITQFYVVIAPTSKWASCRILSNVSLEVTGVCKSWD